MWKLAAAVLLASSVLTGVTAQAAEVGTPARRAPGADEAVTTDPPAVAAMDWPSLLERLLGEKG